MNRLVFASVFVLVGALFASDALGCQRCGIFGRGCKFGVHSHLAVAPVVVKSPEVFLVNNVYPPANGAAALLAQQGGSIYGFQGAALNYALDPAAVLRQAADLAKGAQQLAQTGLDGYNQSAGLALQLNASVQEPLARGTAAAAVLNAAGLNPASQSSSQALRLYRDPEGRWQVENVDAAGVSAKVEFNARSGPAAPSPGTPSPNPSPGTPPPDGPVELAGIGATVSAKCAQCHGLAKSEPAGGIYLDQGHPIDCRQALKSINAVMNGTMPKGQKLTPEELTAIVGELTKLGSVE